MRTIFAEYNPQRNSVDVYTSASYMLRIDRIMAGEDEARKNLFKFMLELSDDDIAALDRLMKKAIKFTQDKEKD